MHARIRPFTGAGLVRRGLDPHTAKQQAIAMIDRQVLARASVIAYGKIHLLCGIVLAAALPLPLLLLVGDAPRRGAGMLHLE